MHTPHKLMLACGLLLAAGGAIAGDTVAQNVTEARQETQIWTTYALSPYLRASDLKVSVKDGKATLTGQLEDEVNKDLATQIALGVSGIKSVDNQIVVQADYVAPSRSAADRGYGEVVDDASITAAVKSKLLWSKHADGLATNVDTNRGKVTLKGTADSGAAKELAGRLATNTRGVLQVSNQLVVNKQAEKQAKAKGAKPSKDADFAKNEANEAGRNVSDGWITTKVKSTFLFSSNVDSTAIKVSTEGGIVTLSGKVDSAAERALAIELAENVRGVKSVQSAQLSH